VKIFLDACAIIYWVEMSEPHYTHFADLLHGLRKKYKRPLFAASHLSLLECRVKPLQERDDNLLNRYQQFFCARDLTLIPLSLDIIEKAAELRAFHRLRTPDALQASSAISIPGDIIFVTGDKIFKKIPTLEVLLIH
jgi:predicted nucleic acid-binding protein